ncbi:hypothetical protein L7H23_13845 [Sphingopyxis sp. BSN-002]|uniref:hypothetical protein n=1 Tax=Sphingopyxis sp. BSN-002 TaxID=2911495 RepID=UPI001EDC58C4|nr:hypothetical protein [Sphingopyxis sp. BSN-002]UKK83640.1 hypothetical protein L7H23_13845 [Sphingopyxis sp. BSN-002]
MKQMVPLVVATLVAIAVALSSPFLTPQFVRPSSEEALGIIEAVGDYEFQSIAAEYGTAPGPLMPEAEKTGKVRVLDAAPCGEIAEPIKCHPIEIEQRSEIGRMLLASWQDASKLIADRSKKAGQLTESFEESASPASEYLLGLQISASRRQDRQIVPSGLTDALVRQHVKLRADTRPGDVRTYLAPWVVGDTAFVEVGLHCGDMCGMGTGYALRKINGKWRVIAVQSRWIA